ncbi:MULTISPECIES: DUF6998 domain-containing protein [Arenibacter]|uniref:DUF6998 domain-containing protein n=1 Tax=Arenibacter TaxID=178469 RepID=UPI0004DFB811|nr:MULTISPECIES: hypothetical protein [Arenibacter]GBF18027.1 hypothetical protein C21_00183 [Arenibacter sp. NBRC 103722]
MKEIQELLDITASLKERYKGKLDFSLDGRLVGDIGEALVSEKFDIELYGKNEHRYDGFHRPTNKKVQIKASMAYNFSYPHNIDLEHFIAVHLEPDGTLEVLYNGPGEYINKFLKDNNRKSYRDIWTTITANHLRELDRKLKHSDRLPEKA